MARLSRWGIAFAIAVLGASCSEPETETASLQQRTDDLSVTPSFKLLTPPASFGNPVYGDALSADGSTVAGRWFLDGADPACGVFGGCTRAFRWTAAAGFQDLGVGDGAEAEVSALTADGSQVAASVGSTIAYRRAAVWTAATGFVDIGTPYFPNDADHSVSYAYSFSGNGSVFVGRAIPTQTSLIPHSMSLSVSGTSRTFSFFAEPPGTFQGQANGVSADGKVIVGLAYDNSSNPHAYRWQGGSVSDLGNLGAQGAQAICASSNGSVVIGTSNTSSCGSGCPDAFRWTSSNGMRDIGNLLSGGMYPGTVSADGSVAVGSGANGAGGLTHAWRYTTRNGLEDLNTVLSRLGVNTNGTVLVFATGVSADGQTITGTAQTTAGGLFPYIATIPAPTCAPITCAAMGKNCGSLADGCGGTLNCGTCSGSQTCGSTNVCGPCTPTSCSAQGANCGGVPDGCGAWLNCGSCSGAQTCGGGGKANVCGTPPPIPIDLTYNPNPVIAGNSSIGTVTLSVPAPSGGAVVTLSCSNSTANSCPATVTVPAGKTTATFTDTTFATVTSDTVSMNAACLNGQCYNTTLYITAACVPATCSSLGDNCGTIGDGCGGTLNCGTCSSGQSCVNNICCAPTTCSAQGKNCGSISNGCGGTLNCGTCASGQTCTNNVCTSGPTLTSLTLNPTSVRGGRSSSTGTVTLSGAAPAGGIVVSLSSSNTNVATVPSSVTVAAGATSASFNVSTQRVNSTTTVVISASYGGVVKSANLSVTSR